MSSTCQTMLSPGIRPCSRLSRSGMPVLSSICLCLHCALCLINIPHPRFVHKVNTVLRVISHLSNLGKAAAGSPGIYGRAPGHLPCYYSGANIVLTVDQAPWLACLNLQIVLSLGPAGVSAKFTKRTKSGNLYHAAHGPVGYFNPRFGSGRHRV